MDKLNEKLSIIYKIYENEKKKKEKYYKKKIKKDDINNIDISIKKFLINRENYEYKNKLRLKSKRLKKEKKVSNDFDNIYNEEDNNKFNKNWNKLNRVFKLNRIYIYLKKKKEELKWSLKEYDNNLELLKERLELNGLNKEIEYDIEKGLIINCNIKFQ